MSSSATDAPPTCERLRFAQLMACLAAACEVSFGRSADHALQTCALGLRLADAWGLRGSELRNVYYHALLRFIGCNADTAVMASIAGDVIELRRAVALLDMADTPAIVRAVEQRIRATYHHASAEDADAAVRRGLMRAGEFAAEIFPGHCEVARRLGQRLGFDERFVTGLGQLYARWDGHGVPAVGGEDVMPAVRVAPAGLSEREAQVLAELAHGLTNKEIARRLGSAPKTVGHQIEAVYRKTGARTRAGATLFALEHGLVARARPGR